MKSVHVLETRRQRRRRRVTTRRRAMPVRHSGALAQPPPPRRAWYAGLALLAALELIDWPLAIVIMLGHEIAHRAHSEALRNFAEGLEAGA
jgi:hypothetical protein